MTRCAGRARARRGGGRVLAGCDDDHETPIIPGPGPAKVEVDTPELRALKAESGIEDCTPGPGGGELPDVTLPCLGGGTSVDLVLAPGADGAEPVAGRVRAVPQGDAGPAGLRRAVRRPGAGARHRLRRPVPRHRPGGGRQARRHLPLAGRPGRRPPGDRRVRQDRRACRRCTSSTPRAGSPTQRSGGVDSADEVADLVREHLGVDL